MNRIINGRIAQPPQDIASGEWHRHVREPPHRGWERITTYIRDGLGISWAKWLERRTGSPTYEENGSFAWCGAFAAWCYRDRVRARIRRDRMASTYRLWRWSRGNDRRIAPEDLEPGDIAVVGPATRAARWFKRWGNHVVIVTEVEPDVGVHTIEGNAKGTLPDGRKREGVVKQFRPFSDPDPRTYVVRYGVRPLLEDAP